MRCWILIGFALIINNCSLTKRSDFQEQFINYLSDTLKIDLENNHYKTILVLNPNSKCWACYQGAVIQATKHRNNIEIVTSYNIANYFRDNKIKFRIDTFERVFYLNSLDKVSSKIYIIKNKRILFEKIIITSNIDSIVYYIDSIKRK